MSYRSKDFKYTIVFDFDGVINPYRAGYNGGYLVEDPTPGIKEVIEALRKNYKVVVVSSRARDIVGFNGIVKYLKEHNISVDGVTSEKVPALVYIDDRGLKFEGTSDGLLGKIYKFTTWWEDEQIKERNGDR